MAAFPAMATPSVGPRNEDVLAVIRRYPAGVTLEQIESELSPTPVRRALQYCVGVLEDQRKIVNVGTPRAPVYRATVSAPTAAAGASATPAVPAAEPASQATTSPRVAAPVVEQRLGATSIAVDPKQVTELVDLIRAAHIPPVAIKPYIRQAAYGLPNPNEFIAAVEAELARR